MRSKAPLALMEQIVMLLVFALAAALCLKAFLWADQTSEMSAERDQAALHTQTAAELLKHAHGDFARAAESAGTWDGQTWLICYDEQWEPTQGEGAYILRMNRQEDELPFLGKATAQMTNAAGEELFSIPVCWQEVTARGG